MTKKKRGRWTRAKPDDPIYKEGLTIYTPRPGYQRPEPKEEPEVEKEPPKA